MRMNWRAVGLARNSSSSQNSPLTVTSMTSSGVSLQVARCTTWVTPASAAAATSRSAIEPRDHLDAVGFIEQTVVAKRANARLGKSRIVKQPRR